MPPQVEAAVSVPRGAGVTGVVNLSGGVGGQVAEPAEAISFEVLSDPAGVPRARAMLQRAEWAARAFARYDKQAVDRVVHAAAQAGAAQAREYAEWAVRETGFGVAEHKVIKNLACSTGLVEAYATHDYVTPRFDPASKIVEVPRPAGADDPRRGGDQPAPAGPGMLPRRRAHPGAGRRRRRCPRRGHPGGGP